MADKEIGLPQKKPITEQTSSTEIEHATLTSQPQLPPASFSAIPSLAFALPFSNTNDNTSKIPSPRTQVAHQFHRLDLTCSGGAASTTGANDTHASSINTTSTTTTTYPSTSTSSPFLPPSQETPQQALQTMARLACIPPTPTPTPDTSDLMDVDDIQPHRKRVRKSDSKIETQDISSSVADTSIESISTRSRKSTKKSAPKSRLSSKKNNSPTGRQSSTRDRTKAAAVKQTPATCTHPPVEPPAELAPDPNEPPRVVEPIRAALTWKEEEITVFDPEDKDDDGVGMDGVAFEPTPELAKIRNRKRHAQLEAYKKQLENDARANRRNKRRQMSPSMDRKDVRRVRFLDSTA